jgi:hypothetical protein
MSIVSAFLVFSMQAARFVIALPASALLFLLPGAGDFRQTCVVNHSNRFQSLHFYSSGLRIFPNALRLKTVIARVNP